MLSEHIDAELSEQDRAALEAHLQCCDSCTRELESLRATVQLLSRMPEVEAPRSFRLTPAGEPAEKPALSVGTPEPTRERPVFLWAMRVSTALAVVGFTIMVAGNVTGLFDSGARDGGQFDAPAASDVPQTESMAMESDDVMNEPEPEAMMAPEPDLPPPSTPMMEPAEVMDEPDAMPEPAAAPEAEAAPEATATPAPQFSLDEDASELSESGTRVEAADDSTGFSVSATDSDDAVYGTPSPSPEPGLAAEQVQVPTMSITATYTDPDGGDIQGQSSLAQDTDAFTISPSPKPQPIGTPFQTPVPEPTKVSATKASHAPTATPFPWSQSDVEEEGAGGIVLWLTTGLGALAAGLALATIYLTVRRRRGVGSS